MVRLRAFLLLLFVAVAPSWADVTSIRDAMQSALAQTDPKAKVDFDQFFDTINENTVRSLSTAEVNDILPLSVKCLQSPTLDVRRAGLLFMMGVTMRTDGASLFGPYAESLETIAATGSDPLRQGALYVLGNMKPEVPAKVLAFLAAHLDDASNSAAERLILSTTLIKHSTDASTIRKVLTVTANQGDAGLTTAVLAQLGNVKTRDSDALAFIGHSLHDENAHVRAAAVRAVGSLDLDVRGTFREQLTRIATDTGEPDETRSVANSVLAQ